MKRLVLCIERLVLSGVAYPHRHAVSHALQAELGRVLASPKVASRIASVGDAVSTPPLRAPIARDATPAQLGRALGGAIGNRIGGRAR